MTLQLHPEKKGLTYIECGIKKLVQHMSNNLEDSDTTISCAASTVPSSNDLLEKSISFSGSCNLVSNKLPEKKEDDNVTSLHGCKSITYITPNKHFSLKSPKQKCSFKKSYFRSAARIKSISRDDLSSLNLKNRINFKAPTNCHNNACLRGYFSPFSRKITNMMLRRKTKTNNKECIAYSKSLQISELNPSCNDTIECKQQTWQRRDSFSSCSSDSAVYCSSRHTQAKTVVSGNPSETSWDITVSKVSVKNTKKQRHSSSSSLSVVSDVSSLDHSKANCTVGDNIQGNEALEVKTAKSSNYSEIVPSLCVPQKTSSIEVTNILSSQEGVLSKLKLHKHENNLFHKEQPVRDMTYHNLRKNIKYKMACNHDECKEHMNIHRYANSLAHSRLKPPESIPKLKEYVSNKPTKNTTAKPVKKRKSEIDKLYASLQEIPWARKFSPESMLLQNDMRRHSSRISGDYKLLQNKSGSKNPVTMTSIYKRALPSRRVHIRDNSLLKSTVKCLSSKPVIHKLQTAPAHPKFKNCFLKSSSLSVKDSQDTGKQLEQSVNFNLQPKERKSSISKKRNSPRKRILKKYMKNKVTIVNLNAHTRSTFCKKDVSYIETSKTVIDLSDSEDTTFKLQSTEERILYTNQDSSNIGNNILGNNKDNCKHSSESDQHKRSEVDHNVNYLNIDKQIITSEALNVDQQTVICKSKKEEEDQIGLEVMEDEENMDSQLMSESQIDSKSHEQDQNLSVSKKDIPLIDISSDEPDQIYLSDDPDEIDISAEDPEEIDISEDQLDISDPDSNQIHGSKNSSNLDISENSTDGSIDEDQVEVNELEVENVVPSLDSSHRTRTPNYLVDIENERHIIKSSESRTRKMIDFVQNERLEMVNITESVSSIEVLDPGPPRLVNELEYDLHRMPPDMPVIDPFNPDNEKETTPSLCEKTTQTSFPGILLLRPESDTKNIETKKVANENHTLRSKVAYHGFTFHYKGITVKKSDNFTQVVLKLSNNRNVFLTVETMTELKDTIISSLNDPNCQVLILNGSGNTFCSGLDLTPLLGPRRKEAADEMAMAIKGLIEALAAFRKPLVTAVEGCAIGFGVTLLTYSDIVLATDTATFYTPYAQLGYMPEGAGTLTLPQVVGATVATDMLLRGRKLTAVQAQNHGLVSEVLTDNQLLEQLLPRVQALAEHPLHVMESTKTMMRWHLWDKLHITLENEVQMLPKQWLSSACQHSIREALDSGILTD